MSGSQEWRERNFGALLAVYLYFPSALSVSNWGGREGGREGRKGGIRRSCRPLQHTKHRERFLHTTTLTPSPFLPPSLLQLLTTISPLNSMALATVCARVPMDTSSSSPTERMRGSADC